MRVVAGQDGTEKRGREDMKGRERREEGRERRERGGGEKGGRERTWRARCLQPDAERSAYERRPWRDCWPAASWEEADSGSHWLAEYFKQQEQ